MDVEETAGVFGGDAGGLFWGDALEIGVITFKNARKALEVIRWLPLDRIMIETDSPYLTPEPFRGKRNDSAKVRYMIEAIAKTKNMDPEEVARITLENGKRFFNIK